MIRKITQILLLTIALLFVLLIKPTNSLAVSCTNAMADLQYASQSDADSHCPVCANGYQYMVSATEAHGQCVCEDPTGSICNKIGPLAVKTWNDCVAVISCNAGGATGYSCQYLSITAPYSSNLVPNGCCNGTTCFTTSAGPSNPAPPPVVGAGDQCDPGYQSGGCGDNNRPNPACPSGYVCLAESGCTPNSGKCILNTTGICTQPADCADGYKCNNTSKTCMSASSCDAANPCQSPNVCSSGTCVAPGVPGQGNTYPWGSPQGGAQINDLTNLLGSNTPNRPIIGYAKIVSVLLSLLILIAIIISLLYLVWGGFDWITSTGEKQKIEKARTKIVFALLGLVVVFISFFIVNVLAGFFKVG